MNLVILSNNERKIIRKVINLNKEHRMKDLQELNDFLESFNLNSIDFRNFLGDNNIESFIKE